MYKMNHPSLSWFELVSHISADICSKVHELAYPVRFWPLIFLVNGSWECWCMQAGGPRAFMSVPLIQICEYAKLTIGSIMHSCLSGTKLETFGASGPAQSHSSGLTSWSWWLAAWLEIVKKHPSQIPKLWHCKGLFKVSSKTKTQGHEIKSRKVSPFFHQPQLLPKISVLEKRKNVTSFLVYILRYPKTIFLPYFRKCVFWPCKGTLVT